MLVRRARNGRVITVGKGRENLRKVFMERERGREKGNGRGGGDINRNILYMKDM